MIYSLGSNQTRGTTIGNKARLLDQAAARKLAVPAGIIVTDETIRAWIAQGDLVEQSSVVSCPDVPCLMQQLGLPFSTGLIAIRSAFSAEDRADQSLAGFFTSRLQIPAADQQAVVEGLCAVLSSAARQPGSFRRDVLVMQMVAAQVAGVAFTEHAYADDLVNFTAGLGDQLVSGAVSGESIQLPKLWRWEGVTAAAGWQSRLQHLLRQVRTVFGKQDWDIEWADDGNQCYLLQVRPITRAPRRNEVFTIANHKEILPDLPSVLMTDIIAHCAGDLFSYYRKLDSSLPANRPFIEVFLGRPFINLSLLAEMMRTFGLPTRLVTDNIGGQIDRSFGLNPLRMLVKIVQFTLPRFALAQVLSVQSAARARKVMLQRTEDPGTTFTELTGTLRWLYTSLVTEMFSLTAAIGPMTLLLRQTGTLEAHNARQQTISTRIYTDLEPLCQLIQCRPDLQDTIQQGEIPTDTEFQRLWQAYLKHYGHRGIYESDISRPRYHEQAATLLPSLLRISRQRIPPPRTLMGYLTLPLWFQASRTIQAREQWRHDCMVGFDRVRRALLQRAREWVARGVLPRAESIFDLCIAELDQLEAGWWPDAAFFQARTQEVARLQAFQLPDLFHRFDDLENYSAETLPVDSLLHGLSLTDGEVQGRAWVLAEPGLHLPEGFDPQTTILVARSVDAGWIPTFALVAGVVVETGGDLSHGSIILREIGLPAITNVHGVMRAYQTGDALHLRAGSGRVERLAVAETETT
jgi:pyruvate,water dikinase